MERPSICMMSDVSCERQDHDEFYRNASGDVLIAGLGLGMIATACARKPSVKSVTVLELCSSVMRLVLPYLEKVEEFKQKVVVVQADARRWQTDRKFDAVWLDIWPNISRRYRRQYKRMETNYSAFLKPGGYIGLWAYDLIGGRGGVKRVRAGAG